VTGCQYVNRWTDIFNIRHGKLSDAILRRVDPH
jgi:hypothetical protein